VEFSNLNCKLKNLTGSEFDITKYLEVIGMGIIDIKELFGMGNIYMNPKSCVSYKI
jgi:serine kinase of HPr protein (carbohydrate metabolism regulator)